MGAQGVAIQTLTHPVLSQGGGEEVGGPLQGTIQASSPTAAPSGHETV